MSYPRSQQNETTIHEAEAAERNETMNDYDSRADDVKNEERMTVSDYSVTDRVVRAIANVQANLGTSDRTEEGQYLWMACWDAESAVKAYREGEAKMAEASELYRYDWGPLGTMITATEKLSIWADIIATSTPTTDPDDLTITVEATRAFAKRATEQLVNNWLTASSTNTVANAIETTKREVYSRFVSTFGGTK